MQRSVSKLDDPISERHHFRNKMQKEAASEAVQAGDDEFPTFGSSENAKSYPKLLREPYPFTTDANPDSAGDTIISSGCNAIGGT